MDDDKFLYKHKKPKLFSSFLLFFFMAITMLYYAIISDNGFVDGQFVSSLQLIKKIGFWVISALLISVLFLILKMLYLRMLEQFVILDTTRISSPPNMISKNVKIDYIDIKSIHIEPIGTQFSLIIDSNSKQLIIPEIMLDDRATFNQLFELLSARTQKAKLDNENTNK